MIEQQEVSADPAKAVDANAENSNVASGTVSSATAVASNEREFSNSSSGSNNSNATSPGTVDQAKGNVSTENEVNSTEDDENNEEYDDMPMVDLAPSRKRIGPMALRRKILNTRPLLFSLVFHPGYATEDSINAKYEGKGTEEDPYLVEWLPNDPYNPMNFSNAQKAAVLFILAFSAIVVAFNSSGFSAAMPQVIMQFGVKIEVATLGTSLFVLGFALGPLAWAPLSEVQGRRVTFIAAYTGMTIFLAACCVAKNIESILIFRFLAGCFGSSPLINVGGVIFDTFSAKARGPAIAIFATAPSLGPTLGPLAGAFLAMNEGWKWVCGLLTILSGFVWLVQIFLLPETFSPKLLEYRAANLHKATGKFYVSKLLHMEGRKDIRDLYKIAFSRPFKILFLEPIVFILSLYIAIIYGTLYMLFGAFPYVFQIRGWNQGVSALPFLGMSAGMIIGSLLIIPDNKRYMKHVTAHQGFAPPETRLPPSIFGALFITVGLFWFAWTDSPNIHWLSPVVASGFFGLGMNLCFLPIMTYLVDSYTIYSASALAANCVFRSLFGFAFPMFTSKMMESFGIHWGVSVPAFLSLMVLPAPWILYRYGKTIRKWSKYARSAEMFTEKLKNMTLGAAPVRVPTEKEVPAGGGEEHVDVEKNAANEKAQKGVSKEE